MVARDIPIRQRPTWEKASLYEPLSHRYFIKPGTLTMNCHTHLYSRVLRTSHTCLISQLGSKSHLFYGYVRDSNQ